jgi:Zn-dependent peptidase ImmA (M78 family)/transcriptional regulator with XRE-family HTH domain
VSANFNPERLTHLREFAALTKEELASACHVTRRAVTDWEGGRVSNPPVETLAGIFEVDTEFFTKSSSPTLDEYQVSFRALSTMSAKKQKRVMASARFAIQVSEWIDSEFSAPASDVPTMQDLLPSEEPVARREEVALMVRRRWGLQQKPIKDMQNLLESRGVRIFSLPADARDVDAFSFWLDGRPFVMINTEKSGERLRFDLAHELGHLVMHKSISTAREKTYEAEANDFASSFLMPADGLIVQVSTASRQLRLDDVMTLKTSWKVSAVAMLRRLAQHHLINDWQYRTWMVALSSAGYRRAEPGGIHRERSRLISVVLEKCRTSGLGVSGIANASQVPRAAVEDAFVGLAVVPLRSGASQ